MLQLCGIAPKSGHPETDGRSDGSLLLAQAARVQREEADRLRAEQHARDVAALAKEKVC